MKALLLLIGMTVSFLLTANLQAQGTAFTYQGQLVMNGLPASGNYDFVFSLNDSSTAGNYIGSSLTNSSVVVTNGLFTTILDFGQVYNGAARWLEISVRTNGASTFTTLSPRQELTPTPYAITASNALTAVTITGSVPNGSLGGSYLNQVIFNNPANYFSGSFNGDGGNLTNLPFAKTFSSTNGFFTFTQNPDGSTNVTFVFTNGTPAEVGAQPASDSLTVLAANNGASLTNLPFAKTFSSTNGYYTFTKNPDGSTNVTFVFTNGTPAEVGAQPANDSLTVLAANNGASLTNLPFAKTFASTNGFFTFTQNPDGSTNVTFVFTNGTPAEVGAQPANDNLSSLAAGNGSGLTNLPFAKTFSSTNGFFTFTQNPDGSTNVTFVFTNGTPAEVGAQPANDNLSLLAAGNGSGLTNLPYAETFSSMNGYFSFGQNPDGSTNVIFIFTNGTPGEVGAQPTNGSLTLLAGNNGGTLTNDLRSLAVYVNSNYVVSASELSAMQTTNIVYYVDTSASNILFTFPLPPPSANISFSIVNFGTNSITLTNQPGSMFKIANGYSSVSANETVIGGYFDKVTVWQNFNGTNWVQLANHRTTQEIRDIAAAYIGMTNGMSGNLAVNNNLVVNGAIFGNAGGLTNLNASQLLTGTIPLSVVSPSLPTNAVFALSGTGPSIINNLLLIPTNGFGNGNFNTNSSVTLTNVVLIEGNISTNSSTNLVIGGNYPITIGSLSYFTSPILLLRPAQNTSNQMIIDEVPNTGSNPNFKTNVWFDICNTDYYTNNGTAGAQINGQYLHLQIDQNGNCYVTPQSSGTSSPGALFLGNNANEVNLANGLGVKVDANQTASGENPGGSQLGTYNHNLVLWIGEGANPGKFEIMYCDTNPYVSSGGTRSAIEVTNNFSGLYSTLTLMKSGGQVNIGGYMTVNSNLTVNASIIGQVTNVMVNSNSTSVQTMPRISSGTCQLIAPFLNYECTNYTSSGYLTNVTWYYNAEGLQSITNIVNVMATTDYGIASVPFVATNASPITNICYFGSGIFGGRWRYVYLPLGAN